VQKFLRLTVSRKPQACSLSSFRVRLRLTVKRVLTKYLCTNAWQARNPLACIRRFDAIVSTEHRYKCSIAPVASSFFHTPGSLAPQQNFVTTLNPA